MAEQLSVSFEKTVDGYSKSGLRSLSHRHLDSGHHLLRVFGVHDALDVEFDVRPGRLVSVALDPSE